MLHSLTVDDKWINLSQVVKAEYIAAYAGGEVSEDLPAGELTKPREAKLKLTLTSLELENSFTYDGEITGTAATNETLTIRGEMAELAWQVLNGEIEPEK